MEPCHFCQEPITCARTRIPDVFSVKCPRCGAYQITGSAIAVLNKGIDPRKGANISGWLKENEDYQINSDNLKTLCNIKTPSFHERADKLLMIIERRTNFAGEEIRWDRSDKALVSLGWCLNEKELNEIMGFLKNSGRISSNDSLSAREFKIAPKGWEHLEHLKKTNTDSQQGFVAMWFDDGLKKVYDDVIAPAIIEAGYKPHRVDQREHNNKIDDEIVAEIRRSRFVLADFTGHRGGVYFEAGFAKGLGIEVFWTCRKDDIENLHFDIRQFNCIDWETDKLDEFKRRITLRIESVSGRGTYTAS